MQEHIYNLNILFDQVRADAGAKAQGEIEDPQELEIKRFLRSNPSLANASETAQQLAKYENWYKEKKLKSLKDRFGKISVEQEMNNARQAMILKLTHILPDWDINGRDLFGEDISYNSTGSRVGGFRDFSNTQSNNRRQLVKELSKAIQEEEIKKEKSQEKINQLKDAFLYAVALQSLYLGDPYIGLHPFSMGSEGPIIKRGIKWVCYLFLAHTKFDRENVLLPQELTDQEVADRLLEAFAYHLFNIARAHNEDQKDPAFKNPYHWQNAPSCNPGFVGRCISEITSFRDMTLMDLSPVFVSPMSSITSAVVGEIIKTIRDASNAEVEEFLRAVLSALLMEPKEGGRDFADFFAWDELKRKALKKSLAQELLKTWLMDIPSLKREEMIVQYQEQVEQQLETLLTAVLDEFQGYQTGAGNSANVQATVIVHLRDAALTKLLQAKAPEEIKRLFIDFEDHLSDVGSFFFKKRGFEDSLALLKHFWEDQAPEGKQQYVKLLNTLVLETLETPLFDQFMKSLTTKQKEGLKQLIFSERSFQNNFIRSLSWQHARRLFAGLDLSDEELNRQLLDSQAWLLSPLLKQMLANKRYFEFEEFTQFCQKISLSRKFQLCEIAKHAIEAKLDEEIQHNQNNLIAFIFDKPINCSNLIFDVRRKLITKLVTLRHKARHFSDINARLSYLAALKHIVLAGGTLLLRDGEKEEFNRIVFTKDEELDDIDRSVKQDFLKISWERLSTEIHKADSGKFYDLLDDTSHFFKDVVLSIFSPSSLRGLSELTRVITTLEQATRSPRFPKICCQILQEVMAEDKQYFKCLIAFLEVSISPGRRHLVLERVEDWIIGFIQQLSGKEFYRLLTKVSDATLEHLIRGMGDFPLTFDLQVLLNHLFENEENGRERKRILKQVFRLYFINPQVQNAVKIRSLISESNWVQLLEVLDHPEDIKQFIQAFFPADNSPSQLEKILSYCEQNNKADFLFEKIGLWLECSGPYAVGTALYKEKSHVLIKLWIQYKNQPDLCGKIRSFLEKAPILTCKEVFNHWNRENDADEGLELLKQAIKNLENAKKQRWDRPGLDRAEAVLAELTSHELFQKILASCSPLNGLSPEKLKKLIELFELNGQYSDLAKKPLFEISTFISSAQWVQLLESIEELNDSNVIPLIQTLFPLNRSRVPNTLFEATLAHFEQKNKTALLFKKMRYWLENQSESSIGVALSEEKAGTLLKLLTQYKDRPDLCKKIRLSLIKEASKETYLGIFDHLSSGNHVEEGFEFLKCAVENLDQADSEIRKNRAFDIIDAYKGHTLFLKIIRFCLPTEASGVERLTELMRLNDICVNKANQPVVTLAELCQMMLQECGEGRPDSFSYVLCYAGHSNIIKWLQEELILQVKHSQNFDFRKLSITFRELPIDQEAFNTLKRIVLTQFEQTKIAGFLDWLALEERTPHGMKLLLDLLTDLRDKLTNGPLLGENLVIFNLLKKGGSSFLMSFVINYDRVPKNIKGRASQAFSTLQEVARVYLESSDLTPERLTLLLDALSFCYLCFQEEQPNPEVYARMKTNFGALLPPYAYFTKGEVAICVLLFLVSVILLSLAVILAAALLTTGSGSILIIGIFTHIVTSILPFITVNTLLPIIFASVSGAIGLVSGITLGLFGGKKIEHYSMSKIQESVEVINDQFKPVGAI